MASNKDDGNTGAITQAIISGENLVSLTANLSLHSIKASLRSMIPEWLSGESAEIYLLETYGDNIVKIAESLAPEIFDEYLGTPEDTVYSAFAYSANRATNLRNPHKEKKLDFRHSGDKKRSNQKHFNRWYAGRPDPEDGSTVLDALNERQGEQQLNPIALAYKVKYVVESIVPSTDSHLRPDLCEQVFSEAQFYLLQAHEMPGRDWLNSKAQEAYQDATDGCSAIMDIIQEHEQMRKVKRAMNGAELITTNAALPGTEREIPMSQLRCIQKPLDNLLGFNTIDMSRFLEPTGGDWETFLHY